MIGFCAWTAAYMMFRRDFREDVDDNLALNESPVSATAARLEGGDVGWEALSPTIAFTLLATAIVSLRWYTRCRLVRCLGMDDYVILLALLLSWTMCGLVSATVLSGIGSYNTGQESIDTIMIAKLIVANNSVWAVTINITKASILTQYLRIFSGRTTRILTWLLMACLLPAVAWAILGGIFLCQPTNKFWNPQLPGHCRNSQTYWTSVATLDILLDFLTLLLPIPSITSLHLPRKQRFATLLVFSLGFSVCAVSVVRLATVVDAAQAGDYIMSGIWSIVWSVVEANVGIVCASLLSLKALLVGLRPGLLKESGVPERHMRIREVEQWAQEDSRASTLRGNGKSMLSFSLKGMEVGKDGGEGK